jgi:hypothetical protein
MLLRIGVAAVFASSAFGQTLIEFETRVRLQMDTGRPAIPVPDRVLRRERISMQGGIVRMDSGDQFLLFDVAKRTVVLANSADKSFVQATSEEFVRPLKSQRAILERPLAGMTNGVEMLEAPPAPAYVWKEKETAADSCRYKFPTPKAEVTAETTMFVYTVPLQGPIADAQAARRQLQLDLSSEAGGVTGTEVMTKCFPRDRLPVRTVTRVETKIGTPVEMRVVAEVVLEALRFEEGPLAADLFVIPEGWTEEPASALERRVLQYLKTPAAIQ